MSRLAKLQLIGPLALFLSVLAAETAAYALSVLPSSKMLWFLNMELFLIFQRSQYLMGDLTTVPGAQLILFALPILLTACYGCWCGRALALALASNLSFAYVAFLLVSWNVIQNVSRQTSVALVAIPSGPPLYTLSVLLGCSLPSLLVSHLLYFSAIRDRVSRI
jgi:hypothetical protein